MAKFSKKLTDTEIKNTKPADKEINLFNGDGLMLLITHFQKVGRKLVFQVCSASDEKTHKDEPWDLSSPNIRKSKSFA